MYCRVRSDGGRIGLRSMKTAARYAVKKATTPATVHDQPRGTATYSPPRQCRRSRGTAANTTTTNAGHSHTAPRTSSAENTAHAASSSTSPTAAPIARSSARVIARPDRKSTRLNSSHVKISYAVFCLKKKKQHTTNDDT